MQEERGFMSIHCASTALGFLGLNVKHPYPVFKTSEVHRLCSPRVTVVQPYAKSWHKDIIECTSSFYQAYAQCSNRNIYFG